MLIVVMPGLVTVPVVVVGVGICAGIVVVICVGQRRYANHLATSDGLVGPGNARLLGL